MIEKFKDDGMVNEKNFVKRSNICASTKQMLAHIQGLE